MEVILKWTLLWVEVARKRWKVFGYNILHATVLRYEKTVKAFIFSEALSKVLRTRRNNFLIYRRQKIIQSSFSSPSFLSANKERCLCWVTYDNTTESCPNIKHYGRGSTVNGHENNWLFTLSIFKTNGNIIGKCVRKHLVKRKLSSPSWYSYCWRYN